MFYANCLLNLSSHPSIIYKLLQNIFLQKSKAIIIYYGFLHFFFIFYVHNILFSFIVFFSFHKLYKFNIYTSFFFLTPSSMPSYKSVNSNSNSNICQLHNLEACLLCSLRNFPNSIQSSKNDLNPHSLELQRKNIVGNPPTSSFNNTNTNSNTNDDGYYDSIKSIRDIASTTRVASDTSYQPTSLSREKNYPYSDSHYSTGANYKFIPNQPKHNPQNYSDSFHNYR